MSTSAQEPPTTLIDRAQTFLSENKRVVLLGAAAALAVGIGGAYYAYSSSSRTRTSDVEKGTGTSGSKKKKSSKSKKKKTAKDGPILEEIVTPVPKVEEEPTLFDRQLSEEEIKSMPVEDRTKLASQLKEKGNAAYKNTKFNEAAVYYTRAIEVTPKPEPVFYSNRAACYVNMSPPNYTAVVDDCDEALKLDSQYVKALNRRAVAFEGLHRYEEALRDFTAATILDRFTNQSTAKSVERVVGVYASQKAAEEMANRQPRLPSFALITAYFAAFRTRPHPPFPEEPSTGDNTLLLALQALDATDYVHAASLINEAIDQGISWDQGRAEALNLRGTFKFLMNESVGAKEDLLASLELVPGFTQSLVKLASAHMEQGDAPSAFKCFEDAVKFNPNDPDIYYHRGQVYFIMNEFSKAAEEYIKSTELDDTFVFSHIQLAVAQYKSGEIGKSQVSFRKTLQAFPSRSEPPNYYGELLLDQGRFPEAVEKFERAWELEQAKHSSSTTSSPPNVLPLVNKGLALFQWKQDSGAAERYCSEALRLDGDCEAAVATMAQLYLHAGPGGSDGEKRIEKAMTLFKKQAEMARSEVELQSALACQFATVAQAEFLKNYPQMAPLLNALSSGL